MKTGAHNGAHLVVATGAGGNLWTRNIETPGPRPWFPLISTSISCAARGARHWLTRSDAVSEALWLALLARSPPRRSWSLARVGRCGLSGAVASASR